MEVKRCTGRGRSHLVLTGENGHSYTRAGWSLCQCMWASVNLTNKLNSVLLQVPFLSWCLAEFAIKGSELLSNCMYQTTWLCVAFWSRDKKQMVTLTCFLCNKSNNEDCSFLFRNARIYYVLTVTARQKVTSGLDLCSHRTRATGIIDFTVHYPNRKKRNVLSQLRKNYFLLQSEMKHFFFFFFSKDIFLSDCKLSSPCDFTFQDLPLKHHNKPFTTL